MLKIEQMSYAPKLYAVQVFASTEHEFSVTSKDDGAASELARLLACLPFHKISHSFVWQRRILQSKWLSTSQVILAALWALHFTWWQDLRGGIFELSLLLWACKLQVLLLLTYYEKGVFNLALIIIFSSH